MLTTIPILTFPPVFRSFLEELEMRSPVHAGTFKNDLNSYLAASPCEQEVIRSKQPLLASFLGLVRRLDFNDPICRAALQPFAALLREDFGIELSREQIFKLIYDHNLWGSGESVSGSGSQLNSTEALRNGLQNLVTRYGIRSMVDAPCGDFHWMKELLPSLTLEKYYGLDIVSSIIDEVKSQYENYNTHFVLADLVRVIPPKADLVLCRHLLIHLTFAEGVKVLSNFKASGALYLLVTSDPSIYENFEVPHTGAYRPVNVELPPYSLTNRIDSIEDYQTCEDRTRLMMYELQET